MAKKQKQVIDNQEDIFGLIEKVEWQEACQEGDRPHPMQLQVGDRIRFRSYGGEVLEGRDQDDPKYYYITANGNPLQIHWRDESELCSSIPLWDA